MKFAVRISPVIFLSLTTTFAYAQERDDRAPESPDSTTAVSEVLETADSLLQAVDFEEPDVLKAAQTPVVDEVTDTLSQAHDYVAQLTDSLESLNKIAELEAAQSKLLDRLKILDLPEEISHYIDSLSELPNVQERLIAKLNKNDSAGSNKSVVLNKVSELLTEEQNSLTDDILPKEFSEKLAKYDGEAWAQKATDLVNVKQLDFTQRKADLNLEKLLDNDLNFTNKLKLNGGDFTGKWNSISSTAGKYSSDVKDALDVKSLGGDISEKEIGEYSEILEKIDSEEYDKLVQEYGSLSDEELDKRIDEQLLKVAEMQEVKQQTSALEQMKTDQFAEMEKLREQYNITDKIAQKKERVLANDVINENRDIVEKVQKQTDKLMGKYVKLENSNDMNTAEKFPEGAKSLGKRLVYGINFQMVPRDNISLDMSPFLGYKITKHWIAGVGGTFRYDFLKEEKYLPDFDREPVYGYRVFSQYKIKYGFFAHGEWERMSAYNTDLRKKWETNYLAGLGKELTIKKKVGVTVTMLYNFNHKNSEAYSSPFVVRMGVKKK